MAAKNSAVGGKDPGQVRVRAWPARRDFSWFFSTVSDIGVIAPQMNQTTSSLFDSY